MTKGSRKVRYADRAVPAKVTANSVRGRFARPGLLPRLRAPRRNNGGISGNSEKSDGMTPKSRAYSICCTMLQSPTARRWPRSSPSLNQQGRPQRRGRSGKEWEWTSHSRRNASFEPGAAGSGQHASTQSAYTASIAMAGNCPPGRGQAWRRAKPARQVSKTGLQRPGGAGVPALGLSNLRTVLCDLLLQAWNRGQLRSALL